MGFTLKQREALSGTAASAAALHLGQRIQEGAVVGNWAKLGLSKAWFQLAFTSCTAQSREVQGISIDECDQW